MAKTYDLFFSIGEACLCSQALRNKTLQLSSYPMDWMAGTDFIERCKILASDFARYIDIHDLSYLCAVRSHTCDAYYNEYNKLTFNHDFPKGESLEDSYPAVKAKYERRIARLLHRIRSAEKVMMVYIEVPLDGHPQCSDAELEAGWKLVRDHFPDTQVDLLYIQYAKGKKITESIGEHITKISADYKNDGNPAPGAETSQRKLKKLLRGYRLRMPLGLRMKLRLLKWVIGILPSKNLRKRLKKQYHV